MKVVQINATCGIGSTGKIAVEISKLLNAEGIENYILCGSKTSGFETGISCSTTKYIKIQAIKSRIWGNYGFNSKSATKRIISHIERINPDIVHLHNIHGHDCNLAMLFEYFRKKKIKLVQNLSMLGKKRKGVPILGHPSFLVILFLIKNFDK